MEAILERQSIVFLEFKKVKMIRSACLSLALLSSDLSTTFMTMKIREWALLFINGRKLQSKKTQ
jgi:hypothetical protein